MVKTFRWSCPYIGYVMQLHTFIKNVKCRHTKHDLLTDTFIESLLYLFQHFRSNTRRLSCLQYKRLCPKRTVLPVTSHMFPWFSVIHVSCVFVSFLFCLSEFTIVHWCVRIYVRAFARACFRSFND